jgi:endonuclease YncB( thermonuclease family)
MLSYTLRFRGPRKMWRKRHNNWPMPLAALLLALFAAFAAGNLMGELQSRFPSVSGDPGAGGFSLCGWTLQRNCVIDGDTIRFGGVKIRLADIDTPEISGPRCAAEAAAGHKAKERLLELINAGPIQLVHRGGPDADKYGRKLRVIQRDGRSLGDTLVGEGLARRWNGVRRSWCG